MTEMSTRSREARWTPGEYLQGRDDDRQQHAERRRQEREKRESDSRVTAAKLPDYEPGHYVVLDRKAFGAHGQKQNYRTTCR